MNWKKYSLISIVVIGLAIIFSSLAWGHSEPQKLETAVSEQTGSGPDLVIEQMSTEAVNALSERPRPRIKSIKFDVAEDMTRFVFDESKTFDDGLPAHGSSFITEGYIYEYGTLTDSNGVLPDGSPEFPDKVIGTWVCRGWFVGEAAHATEGVWVVTTQIYNFGEEYGRASIVSEGYESAVAGEAMARAITGGTGKYVGAKGEAYQTLLGFNEGTEGVNLRFELEFSK